MTNLWGVGVTGMRVARGRLGVQRIATLCATALVFGAGATVTSLAATGWSDQEWVNGGVAGGPGFNTSIFNVNQNVSALGGTWGDFQSSPGETMSFAVPASGLVPGQTTYAFVRLRTTVGSLGGELQLSKADQGPGTDAALFAALRYQARVMADPSGCTAAGFLSTGSPLTDAVGDVALDQAAVTTFSLTAGTSVLPGDEKTVCFAVTLPYPQDSALQGAVATPIWHFTAESDG